MGFLQNDTTNVILDAVLTTKGRELLARNDGSFRITKYCFFDDEVDYSTIKKYGRTIGKEKIEKNTPVFEATTNESLSINSRLVSLSNPNIIRLPQLSLSAVGGTQTGKTIVVNKNSSTQVILSQIVESGAQIDVELKDSLFVVMVDNKFLQIDGQVPRSITPYNAAIYNIVKDPGDTAYGGSRCTFSLRAKALSQTEFDTYGLIFNPNTIETYVTVYGINSGASISFAIQINNS